MSDVQINCPHCDGAMNIKHEWFGMGMNCPICGQFFNTEAPDQPTPAHPQVPVQEVAQEPVQTPEGTRKLQVKHRPPAGQKPKKKKMTVSKTGMRKKPVMKKKSDLPHYPGAAKARKAKRDAMLD